MDESPNSKEPVHDLIAILLASGRFSDDEIAARCAVSSTLVLTLRGSPLFQALVNGYKEKFADKAIDRVIEDVFADTRHNFEWLKKLRDEGPALGAKEARLQLRASEVLFDRQIPKRAEKIAPTVGIVFDERMVRRLENAMAVDEAIDVTPTRPDGPH